MNSRFLPFLVIPAILVIILLQSVFFVVRETENAIVILLGDPQGVIDDAGLNAKLPWAEVVKIDKRNLEYDLARAIEITDVNQERLTVDAFVRYRIDDPLLYYQNFRTSAGSDAGLKAAGQGGIDRIMQNALRQTLGEVSIEDIVTRLRAELMRRIATRMEAEAGRFGVEVIDVKIRQADYPQDIAQTVYDQMSSAREEEAQLIRSEGQRDSTRIQAEANRRRAEILADANRRSLEITGQADATRNCIFAGAYDGLPVIIERTEPSDEAPIVIEAEDGEASDAAETALSPVEAVFETTTPLSISCRFASQTASRDPDRAEFFAFYRSLQAYEKALQDGGDTTILLSPDSEFFRYFNNLEGNR
ncbi:MAG: protease modulator HflC [Pseudomonadota bacterium]